MATVPQPPNIWQLMNYPIPRGKCVHKPSVISSGCPCLRFMLNPLQAASSFACDGCGHHASFHNLKNADEEGVGYVPEEKSMAIVTKPSKKRAASSASGRAINGNGLRKGLGFGLQELPTDTEEEEGVEPEVVGVKRIRGA
ncbi:hypothetical protein BZA77DRAFT_301251 [Pyronema omphalodes]|nr:hypothetical protein BZA77DRAFT_301251 [Pyronema omphalodes]